jgi:hypothetical protein
MLTSFSMTPQRWAPARLGSHLADATAMLTDAAAAIARQPVQSGGAIPASIKQVTSAFENHLQQITAIERKLVNR